MSKSTRLGVDADKSAGILPKWPNCPTQRIINCTKRAKDNSVRIYRLARETNDVMIEMYHRRSHRRKPRRASGGSWRRDPSCSRRGPASNWMTAQPNSNCCLGGVAGATPPENSCRRPETPSHSCSSSLTTPLRSDSECGGRHFSLFRVRVRSRIV